MPNGKNPPPDLDVENSASLGRYLGWMGAVVFDLYHGIEELKQEMAQWSVWKADVDRRHLAGDVIRKTLQEQERSRAAWRSRVWGWAKAGIELLRVPGMVVGAIVALRALGLG